MLVRGNVIFIGMEPFGHSGTLVLGSRGSGVAQAEQCLLMALALFFEELKRNVRWWANAVLGCFIALCQDCFLVNVQCPNACQCIAVGKQ